MTAYPKALERERRLADGRTGSQASCSGLKRAI
jgi:hypothetical protein